jgi:hypothetical protein
LVAGVLTEIGGSDDWDASGGPEGLRMVNKPDAMDDAPNMMKQPSTTAIARRE